MSLVQPAQKRHSVVFKGIIFLLLNQNKSGIAKLAPFPPPKAVAPTPEQGSSRQGRWRCAQSESRFHLPSARTPAWETGFTHSRLLLANPAPGDSCRCSCPPSGPWYFFFVGRKGGNLLTLFINVQYFIFIALFIISKTNFLNLV